MASPSTFERERERRPHQGSGATTVCSYQRQWIPTRPPSPPGFLHGVPFASTAPHRQSAARQSLLPQSSSRGGIRRDRGLEPPERGQHQRLAEFLRDLLARDGAGLRMQTPAMPRPVPIRFITDSMPFRWRSPCSAPHHSRSAAAAATRQPRQVIPGTLARGCSESGVSAAAALAAVGRMIRARGRLSALFPGLRSTERRVCGGVSAPTVPA